MSATLTESIRWDCMTPGQKQAAVIAPLVAGTTYFLTRHWGTAIVKCLNADTAQFRVLVWSPTDPTTQDITGWLVTLGPESRAALSPCNLQKP